MALNTTIPARGWRKLAPRRGFPHALLTGGAFLLRLTRPRQSGPFCLTSVRPKRFS
jgi:hypothetical protein